MSEQVVKASKSPNKDGKGVSVGFFAKILLFVKQVIGELKKVVYPTRNELWTYFWVVIVFVLMLMAFVGVFDAIFSFIVRYVFG